MLADAVGAFVTNLVIAGVPSAIYLAVTKRRGRSWSEALSRLGLGAPKGGAAWTVLLFALATAWIVFVISSRPLEEVANEGSPLRPFVGAPLAAATFAAAFVYGMLQTGFCEELLFRGLVAGAFGRRLPLWKANVLQAIPFILMHALFIFFAPSRWVEILVAPALLALALGWLRLTTGSIWGAVIVHGGSNTVLALLVLFRS